MVNDADSIRHTDIVVLRCRHLVYYVVISDPKTNIVRMCRCKSQVVQISPEPASLGMGFHSMPNTVMSLRNAGTVNDDQTWVIRYKIGPRRAHSKPMSDWTSSVINPDVRYGSWDSRTPSSFIVMRNCSRWSTHVWPDKINGPERRNRNNLSNSLISRMSIIYAEDIFDPHCTVYS